MSWSSRKQTVVATSSCEAEYIALCEACKEASWLRLIVADVLGLKKDPTLPLACDNDGTIAFSHNQSINRRNKHTDIAYHFVPDAIRREVVTLEQCATSEMIAGIFTKPLVLMYDWYHLQQCVQVGLHWVEKVYSRHTAMQSCSNAVMLLHCWSVNGN